MLVKQPYCDRCHRADGIYVKAVDRFAFQSTTRKGSRRFEDLCLEHALLVVPDLVTPDMVAAAQTDQQGTRQAVHAEPLPGVVVALNGPKRKGGKQVRRAPVVGKPSASVEQARKKCPECPRVFEGPKARVAQQLGAHRYRAHGRKGTAHGRKGTSHGAAANRKKVAAAHRPVRDGRRRRQKVG